MSGMAREGSCRKNLDLKWSHPLNHFSMRYVPEPVYIIERFDRWSDAGVALGLAKGTVLRDIPAKRLW